MAASASASASVTLASAPGKVLVAGGYLVLDRAHTGLVVGTDARLYTAVQSQSLDLADEAQALGASDVPVVVASPQFESAWWRYAFDAATDTLRQLASADGGQNPFVQEVLQAALALVNARAPGGLRAWLAAAGAPGAPTRRAGLKIVLAADNDFYSQRATLGRMGLEPTAASLRRVPPRAETGTTLGAVHKTGLGSSAAMVTSLVAAILAHYGVVDGSALGVVDGSALGADGGSALGADGGRHRAAEADCVRLIHNVAQYAHCVAQGKVGSGFDVSAAVHGSHVYRRFSPAVLAAAMAGGGGSAALVDATSPQNPGWDSEVAPLAVPPRLVLRLADVDAGSSTPGMVKKVLQWQRDAPEQAARLLASLDAANGRVRELWAALATAHHDDSEAYDCAVDWCAQRASAEWSTGPGPAAAAASAATTCGLLADLAAATLRMRQLQRELGDRAGVPIEPPEQTRLLDACMAVPGVCMAAVPGAGGFDAIFCIVLGPAAADAVERLWSSWSEMSVSPLLAKQASRGVCLHSIGCFPDLAQRLS
ncbi:phosphomevalonate kinase [Coemansia nantahalensis]|uniref:Phosphomevalonate kinase n=1 Tax=Coemansia nantahalensis TaxID=2789366 RepID=A0ACC1K6Y5_9FUNG|nr:phosphomevalonate kinase [Coemansia nantahalensis]KAJ2774695.1 phosphomevalonate kinase [Coemansia nantahalensis]